MREVQLIGKRPQFVMEVEVACVDDRRGMDRIVEE
jgi:hypothetical protein